VEDPQVFGQVCPVFKLHWKYSNSEPSLQMLERGLVLENRKINS
jgi:hypothetical protein